MENTMPATVLANPSIIDRLSVKLIVLFAKVKARKKQLDAKEKILGNAIKALMLKGSREVTVVKEVDPETKRVSTTYTYAPAESPYLQDYLQYEKQDVSWKDECERAYKLLYGKTWRKELDKRLEDLGTVEADRLNEPKVNPNYKAGLVA